MTASTVAQYLAALPANRRAALSAVRKANNENGGSGAHCLAAAFGMTPIFCAKAMKRGSSL